MTHRPRPTTPPVPMTPLVRFLTYVAISLCYATVMAVLAAFVRPAMTGWAFGATFLVTLFFFSLGTTGDGNSQ
jgi:hypothetical protein